MATIGQTEQVAVRYVKETTWGTTPSSNLTNLRYTSESLQSQKDTQPSADIIQERRVREILELGTSSDGNIEFELSYGALDDFLEGALMNTWTLDSPSSGTDTLKDGTTLTSFTVEKEYTDLDTPEFYLFTGCRIGSLSLNVEPGNPITATVGFLGKGGSVSTSSAGTGNTAATTNDVMVVGAHVSDFQEGGATNNKCLGFTLDLSNSLRNQRNIASLDPYNIAAGTLEITGTARFYMEDSTEIDKFEDFPESSLQLVVADDSSNQYQIDLKAVNYTNGVIEHQGRDGDAIVALDWQAFKDSSASTMIEIQRS